MRHLWKIVITVILRNPNSKLTQFVGILRVSHKSFFYAINIFDQGPYLPMLMLWPKFSLLKLFVLTFYWVFTCWMMIGEYYKWKCFWTVTMYLLSWNHKTHIAFSSIITICRLILTANFSHAMLLCHQPAFAKLI